MHTPLNDYYKRLIDEKIDIKIEGAGALLIQGPKCCGKSTTALHHSNSALFLDDYLYDDSIKSIINVNPDILLKGAYPRVIDEWQLYPKLWDQIRRFVDFNVESRFILTGSATPVDKSTITHTGTGRFSFIKMRTMSLYEAKQSSAEVSLKNLFDGEETISGTNNLGLEDLANIAATGGWPSGIVRKSSLRGKLDQAFNYLESIINSDIEEFSKHRRNKSLVRSFLSSYARNIGSQASQNIIRLDVSLNQNTEISEATCTEYLETLRNMFIIEELEAWNPNLRSKTAIRTSPTRYFVDPSLAVASLNIGPGELLKDLRTFGFIFENLCIRDLRTYAESIQGSVYHYRDKNGLECDAVIRLMDGRFGLCEIKLGGPEFIEEGARNLKKLSSKIDTSIMGKPSFLMVLTGITPYAYKRDDGVFVVPLGTLKN